MSWHFNVNKLSFWSTRTVVIDTRNKKLCLTATHLVILV